MWLKLRIFSVIELCFYDGLISVSGNDLYKDHSNRAFCLASTKIVSSNFERGMVGKH